MPKVQDIDRPEERFVAGRRPSLCAKRSRLRIPQFVERRKGLHGQPPSRKWHCLRISIALLRSI